jgi:hypothetical protein
MDCEKKTQETEDNESLSRRQGRNRKIVAKVPMWWPTNAKGPVILAIILQLPASRKMAQSLWDAQVWERKHHFHTRDAGNEYESKEDSK